MFEENAEMFSSHLDLTIKNPKLLVASHYESIVNSIDLKCEQYLSARQNEASDSERESLNSLRTKFIADLEQIKTETISRLDSDKELYKTLAQRLQSFSLNKNEQPIRTTIEKIFNHKFPIQIQLDCFVQRRSQSDFGLIVLSDVYFNSDQVRRLSKYINTLTFDLFDCNEFNSNKELIEFYLIKNRIYEHCMRDGAFFSCVVDFKSKKEVFRAEKLDFSAHCLTRTHFCDCLSLENLKHLDLSDTCIGCLDTKIFAKFPKLEVLRMARTGLVSCQNAHIKFENLPNLRVLDLSQNELLQLNRATFSSLNSLRSLDLSYCGTRIERHADLLENMVNLVELNLKRARIRCVDERMFSHLINLKSLDLREARIEEISEGGLDSLKQLETLLLNRNCVANLPDNLFNLLTNLKYLDLSSNNLIKLNAKQFSNLSNLKILNLSANRLDSLNLEQFENLEKLETLDLSSNFLSKWKDSQFKGLKSLQKLNLSRNKLENGAIGAKLFSNLDSLEFLRLNSCNISEIESKCFDQMKRLRRLNLANNKIEKLNDEALTDNLKYLACFSLRKNPILKTRADLEAKLREKIVQNKNSFAKNEQEAEEEGAEQSSVCSYESCSESDLSDVEGVF